MSTRTILVRFCMTPTSLRRAAVMVLLIDSNILLSAHARTHEVAEVHCAAISQGADAMNAAASGGEEVE